MRAICCWTDSAFCCSRKTPESRLKGLIVSVLKDGENLHSVAHVHARGVSLDVGQNLARSLEATRCQSDETSHVCSKLTAQIHATCDEVPKSMRCYVAFKAERDSNHLQEIIDGGECHRRFRGTAKDKSIHALRRQHQLDNDPQLGAKSDGTSLTASQIRRIQIVLDRALKNAVHACREEEEVRR